MPVYAKNTRGVAYTLPVLNTVLPIDGSVVNVTSEIRGKTGSEYATLQTEQVAGRVSFSKTSEEVTNTPGLVIESTSRVYDDSQDPRASSATPSSPAFFDSVGQSVKTISIDASKGATELEFWGSIDVSTADTAAKKYSYVGSQSFSEGFQEVRKQILDGISRFRFIKIDAIRGVSPIIHFQASRL